MAIGTLLGLAAGASALGSVAQGAGTIAQARQQFSAEDRKRLEELEELERRGELGLAQGEREAIRAEATAERGAILRSQEARALRESAAAPTVTGRDVFLREQVAQQEARQLEESARAMETEADRAATAAQRAEMSALEQGRAARRAGTVQGVASMVTGAATAASGALEAQAAQDFQAELEGIRQGAAKTDAELLEEFRRAQQGSRATPYNTRAPSRG
tara:strand:+ start:831 stop:1484 length:654 start_codon:yes stop_codon:yes gene_type:complete